jgi:hypothetical protein
VEIRPGKLSHQNVAFKPRWLLKSGLFLLFSVFLIILYWVRDEFWRINFIGQKISHSASTDFIGQKFSISGRTDLIGQKKLGGAAAPIFRGLFN